MPLQKLQFRPGVNREGTTLANEGGWFACDKVRFRSGYPEKIGGWTAFSNNTFLGICRGLWNWVTLNGFSLVGAGTNLKYYIEDGGEYYDITPIAYTSTNTVRFSANTVTPSSVITVTDSNASSLQVNDFVTFSSAVGLGGNITAAILNQEYQIVTVLSNTSYTISARAVSFVGSPGASVLSNASDTGNGGSATDGAYQINTGFPIYVVGTGWGTGPWSRLGWGDGFTTGVGQQLRLWSQFNFGQDLLFSPRGGPLLAWEPGFASQPAYTTRGVIVTGPECPTQVLQLLISDATRIAIALGCDPYSFDPGAGRLDPLLVRWSVAEDYTDWAPAITNQAGSYRLSHGSSIISALQTRQENLIWTDTAVYSMQYVGPPFVWTFNILADNISIAGPNASTTVNGIVYWMGVDKFYMYAGRVETLPSTLRQFVFSDINTDQLFQVAAGTNEGYNEVWWHYCSADSDVNNRYVIYNHLDKVWYYGTLPRTAWLDSPLRASPMAADPEVNRLVYHEIGVNNNSTNNPQPINAYVQSSDFDIGDGHNYGFVWRVIPDVTFDGSSTTPGAFPQVDFTVIPRRNPGALYGPGDSPTVTTSQNYAASTTYNVQQFTEIVYTRIRGRQMAFRLESNTLGTQWQLGAPRIDVRPDGRR
jgi:hypothetical protein